MANSLAKLDRDKTLADLANVEDLLLNLKEGDFVTKIGLEERRLELIQRIESMDGEFEDGLASIALFFGGKPVVANKGIESEFAGEIVRQFQDLVAKFSAQSEGALGERGVVPHKNASRLHITNVVRGSFGFLFEEVSNQPDLVATSLKKTVGNVADLLGSFTQDDDDAFAESLSEVDQRVLLSANAFFSSIQKSGATFRLVAGEQDNQFGSAAIARAIDRASTSTISEENVEISGYFWGALPESHRFEILDSESQEVLSGKIDQSLSRTEIAQFNNQLTNKRVRAMVHRRNVSRNGIVIRSLITLLSLDIDG